LALDGQVVAARLAALDQYLRFLAESAQLDLSAFTSDPRNYAAAERFLHLAIESVLDIGTHCVAGLGLARPATYADICPPWRRPASSRTRQPGSWRTSQASGRFSCTTTRGSIARESTCSSTRG